MNLNIKEMKNKSQLYRLIFMLLVIAAASLFVPRFATSGNMVNLIRQIFLLCILGYAMSLTMLVKGLDLSIGSVAAFSSVMAATVIAKGNVFLGVLTGLGIGAAIGVLNGFMISKFKLPDFIMTFSMKYIALGLTLTYTQGEAIYGYPKTFTWIGKGSIGPIPVPVIISIVLFLILYFILYKTVLGRSVYAVGSSKEAARYTGISVDKVVMSIYGLSGLIAGLAGLIFIARLNSADADLGVNWPLEAIAVSVIGGVTFAGGEGNLAGLIIGGIVMAVIGNCINLLGIPPRFQDFFLGFVIIFAVAVDHYTKKKSA